MTIYRDVARSIELIGTAESFSAYRTPDDVSDGKEVVAEGQKYYRPLGITKSGRFDPEGQQGEERRQETQPGPTDHPTFGESLVFRAIIRVGAATRFARDLK